MEELDEEEEERGDSISASLVVSNDGRFDRWSLELLDSLLRAPAAGGIASSTEVTIVGFSPWFGKLPATAATVPVSLLVGKLCRIRALMNLHASLQWPRTIGHLD